MKEDSNTNKKEDKRKLFISQHNNTKEGDLKQKSLAMYKSINNIFNLVNKKNDNINKIPFYEMEAFSLDFTFREMMKFLQYKISQIEIIKIREIVENILSSSNIINQCKIESSSNEENMMNSSIIENILLEKLKNWKEQFFSTNIDNNNNNLNNNNLNNNNQDNNNNNLHNNNDNNNNNNIENNNDNNKDSIISTSKEKCIKNEQLKLEISMAETKGERTNMEDQHSIINYVNELLGLNYPFAQAFFGIYDGHAGSYTSEYARIHLYYNIMKNELYQKDIVEAIHNGYKITHKNFLSMASRESINSGTTAVTIILSEQKIYIANVGDSEAVLCKNGKAILLTYSHTLKQEDEKKRIKDAGGAIIWWGSWRVNGVLSITRSIGDINLSDIIIPDPKITVLSRSMEDQFIIMATDGLWDVIQYQEAVDLVQQLLENYSKSEISKILIEEALKRKSMDNITVIIIFFLNDDISEIIEYIH